jgi:hypothetical protein
VRYPGGKARENWKEETVTSGMNLNAARCEALFASALQRSDHPSLAEVREAIRCALRKLGSRGCAACVAQEFGDHPETAILRMRWAREAVEQAFLERVGAALPPDGQRDLGVARPIAEQRGAAADRFTAGCAGYAAAAP